MTRWVGDPGRFPLVIFLQGMPCSRTSCSSLIQTSAKTTASTLPLSSGCLQWSSPPWVPTAPQTLCCWSSKVGAGGGRIQPWAPYWGGKGLGSCPVHPTPKQPFRPAASQITMSVLAVSCCRGHDTAMPPARGPCSCANYTGSDAPHCCRYCPCAATGG